MLYLTKGHFRVLTNPSTLAGRRLNLIARRKIEGFDSWGKETPDAEDRQRNTDLIVFRVETLRVACRVRRFRYLAEYPFDFTVRSDRPNGVDTELAKILAGYGDYLVYAFASQDEQSLIAWRILDLRQFRLWFHRQTLQHKTMPGMALKNEDGSSAFRAFDVRRMPAGVVAHEFGFSAEPGSSPRRAASATNIH